MVAVILVNYNGKEDTIECINSILKSNYSDITIVVVDNASSGDDCEIIRREFDDIILIKSEFNGGFSYGNNLGIKWALDNNAEYVMLLNNDTIVDVSMISQLVKYADQNTITTPTMLYYDNKSVMWFGGGYINKWTGNTKHYNMNKTYDDTITENRRCTFSTGCCMLISAEIIKRIGLLDEEYFLYYEDSEYCIRALLEDVCILYIPKAILFHKISKASGGASSPYIAYYMTRNRLYLVKKYKSIFKPTAFLFVLLTRLIRALLSKNNRIRKAYLTGIKDYMIGKKGSTQAIL